MSTTATVDIKNTIPAKTLAIATKFADLIDMFHEFKSCDHFCDCYQSEECHDNHLILNKIEIMTQELRTLFENILVYLSYFDYSKEIKKTLKKWFLLVEDTITNLEHVNMYNPPSNSIEYFIKEHEILFDKIIKKIEHDLEKKVSWAAESSDIENSDFLFYFMFSFRGRKLTKTIHDDFGFDEFDLHKDSLKHSLKSAIDCTLYYQPVICSILRCIVDVYYQKKLALDTKVSTQ